MPCATVELPAQEYSVSPIFRYAVRGTVCILATVGPPAQGYSLAIFVVIVNRHHA